MAELTREEEKLVDNAKKRILEHARSRKESGLYDVLYAFVLSESGEIYEGKPFESNQPSFNFCAERHAINAMQFEETEETTIKSILVAGPVPDEGASSTMPCGACRHAINEFGDKHTTVLVSKFIREEDVWSLFSEIEKYNIEELYPKAYEPVEWED